MIKKIDILKDDTPATKYPRMMINDRTIKIFLVTLYYYKFKQKYAHLIHTVYSLPKFYFVYLIYHYYSLFYTSNLI